MRLSRQQLAALNAVASNRAYMATTGLTYAGDRLWTAAEIEILTRVHSDYGALMQAMPGRTRCAIQKKAQALGITRSRRVWSDADVAIMKPL